MATSYSEALADHRKIIINQFTKDLGDLLSCLTIMYMLHSFGPYSQLKQRKASSRYMSTASQFVPTESDATISRYSTQHDRPYLDTKSSGYQARLNRHVNRFQSMQGYSIYQCEGTIGSAKENIMAMGGFAEGESADCDIYSINERYNNMQDHQENVMTTPTYNGAIDLQSKKSSMISKKSS
eukprot:CAMPEP_0116872356 /NCGR_PEP_ID=MMETSP0463-20121206/3090_1 /TAXON_ID=181622 /ORGANISM="Strombidinopsis sp, Strain SopsisLIS2011" /LENGTH=181 /DNA_ID=CAMNT_0004512463 /DNA_START=696 /DNA_END=1241 /DNA_ORIENTATION=-